MSVVPDRYVPFILRLRRRITDYIYGLSVAARAVRLSDWSTARTSLRSTLDEPGVGRRSLRVFYRRLMQEVRRVSPTLQFDRMLFTAVADPARPIFINPNDIVCRSKYGHNLYAGEILSGDWDLRTEELQDTQTYQSVIQHFRDGRAWEGTDFFQKSRDVFERGEKVRGARSLVELKHYYETHVQHVYESIVQSGFLARNILHIHIGRAGRLILGFTGIQRLAMAKVAGVTRMPCMVHARHVEWQFVRERVAQGDSGSGDTVLSGQESHPDLQNLMCSQPPISDCMDAYGMAEHIPSMGGTKIGPYLRELARTAEANTAVVEVGSWLGAGTVQLALGIRERVCPEEVQLHCYDRWRASQMEVQKASRWGLRLSKNEDTLPRVQSTMEALGVPVEFHQGDLLEARWNGVPISVYVDDASKMPDLFIHALLTFGRSWIPGLTVIALMDYDIWQETGAIEHQCQKSFIEANADCFTRLPCRGHALFRYTKAVDWRKVSIDGLTLELLQREKEITAIKNSTSWRITAPIRWFSNVVRTPYFVDAWNGR